MADTTLVNQMINLKQENTRRAEEANKQIDALIKDLEFITGHIGEAPNTAIVLPLKEDK